MDAHHVSRQADYTLDVPSRSIQREAKDNDVAALRFLPVHGQTINDDEFAIVQVGLHAVAFNAYAGRDQVHN
jgi:hypothetical protein